MNKNKDKNEIKELKNKYAELYTQLDAMSERFDLAIRAEKKKLKNKITLVAILLMISCAAMGISIWQVVERATTQLGLTGVGGGLVFTTLILLVVTVLLCSVMISDIRQHRRDLTMLCIRFEENRKELENDYKKKHFERF
jgi:uncharacterized membrane protein